MIDFPFFTDHRAVLFAACGRVKTKNPKLLKRFNALRRISPMVARSGTGRDATYLQLLAGTDDPQVVPTHLHVNVFRRSFLTKKPPGPTHEVAEIQDTLAEFTDLPIDVYVTERFHLSIDDLRPNGVVRSGLVETRQGDITIRQTGARLSIEGGPIENLQWWRRPRNELRVELEAESLGTTVHPRYLNEFQEITQNAFRLLILDNNV